MSPIKIDPEIMSGTPCFAGTRVPVDTLFKVLARGQSLDYFLDGWPTVSRELAVAVLDLASERVTVATSDVA